MAIPLPAPLYALDFETTGLTPRVDQVVEVGLVGARSFHALVSDARPSSPEAEAVHRLSAEVLRRDGMTSSKALDGLLEALGDGPVRIVCHNASFERGFLEAWADRCGRKLPEIEWLCTMEFARALCPERTVSKGLQALAWRLGLGHGPLHRAQEDASLTLRLWEVLQGWVDAKAALNDPYALIYVAGPLRGDGSEAWIRHNRSQMLLLAQWVQGVFPEATLVVPHGNFNFLDESRDPEGLVRARAMRSCERILARCDALLLCGHKLSPGMVRERDLALALGLPVRQVAGWDAFRALEPLAAPAGAA